MGQLREKMYRDLKLRGLASGTIERYLEYVESFFKQTRIKDPQTITIETVLQYQFELLEKHKLAPSTVNVRMAALRFFFLTTLKKPWDSKSFPFVKVKRR